MSTRAAPRTYRVVQWATGNVGLGSLRAVIQHPHLKLVGLWVHSPEKAGLDAGEMCGMAPVGVKATNSIDDIIALKPDCVLYMQQSLNPDELCKLLASGINVVTTRAEFHNPAKVDPELRRRVEEACRTGGASLHSAGSTPGFVTEHLPIVLASLQRRIDLLTIDEYGDVTSRNSPDLLFRVMGFGKKIGAELDHEQTLIHQSRINSLALLADAIGLPCEEFQIIEEYAAAKHDVHMVAGSIKAGTVGATRTTQQGLRNGRPFMRVRSNWYVTRDLDQDWELGDNGWRIRVEGDTPIDMTITFPVSEADYPKMTPGLTAHPAVNAVPYVVEAAPGIRSSADLPPLIPKFG